ncbi:MAG: hypothetical protein DWH84_02030 [Planctomycetota bacterium]|nr:MAG: hypothetical protein DWH84_02030 [Planctomycetota bacterium]
MEDVGQGYVTVGKAMRFLNVLGWLTREDRAQCVEQFPATIATTNSIRKYETIASTDLQWRAILVVCLMEGKEPPSLAQGYQPPLNKLDLTRCITYHNPLCSPQKVPL